MRRHPPSGSAGSESLLGPRQATLEQAHRARRKAVRGRRIEEEDGRPGDADDPRHASKDGGSCQATPQGATSLLDIRVMAIVIAAEWQQGGSGPATVCSGTRKEAQQVLK